MSPRYLHHIDPEAAAAAVRELARDYNRGRFLDANRHRRRLEALGLVVTVQLGGSAPAREAAAREKTEVTPC